MKYAVLALGLATLAGCQSGTGPAHPKQADFINAKPATADQEARFLAAGERMQAKAQMRKLETVDPTGLSRAGSYYRDSNDADMAEIQSLMPAMQASSEKRVDEVCSNPEMARYMKNECANWPAIKKQRDAVRRQAQQQGY